MIVKEIADLHKDLREKIGKNIPYSVTWELTYRCANNCNYCYQKKIRNNISDDVPLEKIISTLISLYDMGCRNIIFSGGDPLLHGCFEEILSVASKIGFKISIYTSGVQIRESVFDAIFQSNIDSIEITILGSDAQTHDLLAGRKDSFDNIISNVTRLVGCGINVILKTTLEEKNIDLYDEMCVLAQKLTGKELLVNTRFLQQYGIPRSKQLNRGLPFEKLVNFYLQHRELVTQYKREQIVMCEAGISRSILLEIFPRTTLETFGETELLNRLEKDTSTQIAFLIKNVYLAEIASIATYVRVYLLGTKEMTDISDIYVWLQTQSVFAMKLRIL